MSEGQINNIRFHHAAITVSNIDTTIQFYKDILGMRVIKDVMVSGKDFDRVVGLKKAQARIVFMELNGSQIEFVQFLNVPGNPIACDIKTNDYAINHLSYEVQDIGAVYSRLREKGIKFRCPPQALRGGKGNTCTFFTDPDGITVEILEVPKAKK